MKSQIEFLSEQTKKVFSEINYKNIVNAMIAFNGDMCDDRSGVFNIHQIVEFAFIEYNLKFTRTNIIYVAYILFKQLRENGDFIESKLSDLSAKQKELCPQFSGKIYGKVKLFDDFTEIRNLNDYFRQKRIENEKHIHVEG